MGFDIYYGDIYNRVFDVYNGVFDSYQTHNRMEINL